MEKSIEDMTEEAFQKHIQALAIRRLDKPKKLSAECAKYWGEIISQQYNRFLPDAGKDPRESAEAAIRVLNAAMAPTREELRDLFPEAEEEGGEA